MNPENILTLMFITLVFISSIRCFDLLEEIGEDSIFDESSESNVTDSYVENAGVENEGAQIEDEEKGRIVNKKMKDEIDDLELHERILIPQPVAGSFCLYDSMCKTSSTLLKCYSDLKCRCLWNYPHQLGILNMAWCGECKQCVSIQGSACDKNANGLGTIRCGEGLICRQTEGRPDGQGTCGGTCFKFSFLLLSIVIFFSYYNII